MPRLPDVTALGERPTPQPAGGIVGYRADFGGNEAPGAATAQVGAQIGVIMEQLQEKADTTRVEDAWNRYKNTALDLTAGEKGLLKLKGGEAVNANMMQTSAVTLGAARGEIEAGLANDNQRRRFAERAAVTDLQVKHQVLSHMATEQKEYDKQVMMGSEAAAKAQISAMPTSPDVFNQARDTLMAQADAYLKNQGVTDKKSVENYKAKVNDALWATRIDALLYTQPILADAMFRANAKEITSPELKLQLQAKTREAALAVNASIEAQKLIDETRALTPPATAPAPAERGTEVGLLGKIPPSVQAERDRTRLRILNDELADNPNDKNLQRAIRDTEAGLRKVTFQQQDPLAANTNGLPNSRDIAAQLPMMEGKIEKRANELYGPDQGNPDRAAFIRRATNELRAKVSSEVQQLNAIQRQAQGDLIDAVTGLGQPATGQGAGGLVPTGGQGQARAVITSFGQIQADPKLMRAWQLMDPAAKVGIERLMEHNLRATDKGDERLYRSLWNRIHLEPGDPQKIDFYQQIIDPTIADRLSIQQIGQLRLEIDRAETPGGRSLNQMRKAADAQVSNWFRTTLNSNLNFRGVSLTNPGAYIDWTNRWNEDVGQKVDDYIKAGHPEKVRAMFMVDTPESVITPQYLQTFTGSPSTSAQGLSQLAAKAAAGTAPAQPPAQMPATITTKEAADAWIKTLPPTVDRFVGPDGQVRMIPATLRTGQPSQGYGARADGTQKGVGYFGELPAPGGKVSTEISIGVNIGGKEMEIPALVPTLTRSEIDQLLTTQQPTKEIVDKAVAFAKTRIAAGKDPFAGPGEQVAPPAAPPKMNDQGKLVQPQPVADDQMPVRLKKPTSPAEYRGEARTAVKNLLMKIIPDKETVVDMMKSTAFWAATRGAGLFASLLAEGATMRGEQVGQALPTEREVVNTVFRNILAAGYTDSDVKIIKRAIEFGDLTPAEMKKAKYMLADIEGE